MLLKVVWVLTPVRLVVVDVKLEILAVELVAKGDELLGFKVFTVDVTLFEAEPSAFFDDKSELLLT